MRFNEAIDTRQPGQEIADPIDQDPGVKNKMMTVVRLEKQLAQAKADLNNLKAKKAQEIARKQSQKAAATDVDLR